MTPKAGDKLPNVDTESLYKNTDTKALDIGAAYSGYFDQHDTFTPEEAKRLRWKLDLRLIPILAFNIILGATDKASTSTGTDTHRAFDLYADSDGNDRRAVWHA